MSLTHLDDATDRESAYKQVQLELWHPGCWTLQVTDEHAGTHVIEKSLYTSDELIKGDFILVSEGDAPMEPFINSISEHQAVEEVAVLKRSAGRARAVVNYQRDRSVLPQIVNSDFMPIERVHITGGREFWTVLVRESAVSENFERMEDEYNVDITAIKRVDPGDSLEFADAVNHIHDNLSSRQRECLFQAKEEGYYNWPRDLTAKEVAEEVGVSSPTFLEHLRTGEQKILHAVLDELKRRYTRH